MYHTTILSTSENTPDQILYPDQTLTIGYKLGLRAFLSAFYLEVDYTVFPNSFKNLHQSNHAHTISATAGLMFNL
jgi:hypothetical protein